jgi:soluble lytic murein transglycosylase-like protein
MKSFRLALPLAALAAAFGVSQSAAAEIASAQQFMIEESNRAQQTQNEQNAQPAAEPAASDADDRQQPKAKKNANPWKGLIVASAAPLTAEIPASAQAALTRNAGNNEVIALIDKHAAANGLPTAFARAVVRIESNMNPGATGQAGEVGLMQIKYETAKGMGYTGTRADLYNPDTNLQWGMKYLAMSWKLGGNTPCGAVLRYQAGHAATRPTAASNLYCAKVQKHMASN